MKAADPNARTTRETLPQNLVLARGITWESFLQQANFPVIDLVNRNYFNAIEADLRLLAQPTVKDAILAMRARGNAAYFHEFPYLYEQELREQFKTGGIKHEISHLCARIGHTPQMEQTGLAFDTGLAASIHSLAHEPDAAQKFKDIRDENIRQYKQYSLMYQAEPTVEASRTDWAVHCAAGMYLREKLDAFAKAGLLEAPQDYRRQKAFSEAYRIADSAPGNAPQAPYNWKALLDAPYDMITLSKQEWHAIEAVALGLCAPEKTPYPERMAAIKQALVATGVYFDKPQFAEKLKAEQAEKARHGTTGRGQE